MLTVLPKNLVKLTLSVLFFTHASSVTFAAESLKPVKVANVIAMPMAAKTQLNATLYSRSHIPITASLNGRVDFLAEPGDYVNQGDNIALMDLLPIQLRQAEQKAQITRANIHLTYIKNELSRLDELRKTQATSQFQLDQMRSEYDLATADLEISQLKLAQISDQLTRGTIKAPFSGVITERLIRAGSDVNRGDVLLRLLDTENLEARLFVPIKYLAFVNKGQQLTINASGQTTQAVIAAKIPRADPRSQTFEVRLNIPKRLNEYWAAGQLVSISVPTQKAKPSLTVPRDALIVRRTGSYVIKVASDNSVLKTAVIVGKGDKDRVAVTGKLTHGDKIAIRGAERLSDGDKVVIQ